MGNTNMSNNKNDIATVQATATISNVATKENQSENEKEITIMKLQHPGHCTGMFWRGDPYTGKSAPSNDNWPKSGALLKGSGPFNVKGEDYFKVIAIQQAGTKEFKSVPEGTWMLYNQGGKVLHRM